MHVAAITDIHANLPALEAVLETIDETGSEEIWCLGDVVGYGADPNACAELIEERCSISLAGNHDLAVLGKLRMDAFSAAAAQAVAWTRDHVSERTLDFLRGLHPAGRQADVDLFHASPRDPVWEYVLSAEEADACLAVQEKRIALIGHSHASLFFMRPAGQEHGGIRGALASDGKLLDLSQGRWLVNPGSVGQPRDGDPRASWLELDTDQETARFRRIPYDIERAAESIASADLPGRLASRLYLGR